MEVIRQEDEDVFLTVRVPLSLRERLHVLAAASDRTLAAEIRRALREHADRQEDSK